jgi:carbon monoxide dehydrogenase subunit G
MELVNEFTVNAGIATTGATHTEGDTYRGTVSVKVGPITAKFKGEANFVEQDAAAHKAVLKAAGRDTGGKGNASALITAQLSEVSKETTHVKVTTDLTITGKVAQFGRGALADVSTKLIDQFVQQLETTVLNEPEAPAAGAADTADTKPAAPKKAAAAKKAPAKKARRRPTHLAPRPPARTTTSTPPRSSRPRRRSSPTRHPPPRRCGRSMVPRRSRST